MKTTLRLLPLLALLIVNPLPAQGDAAPADREVRAKKATEQRLAYAASAEYNPYDTKSRDCQKTAAEFLDKKEFAQAIAETQKGLALNKYDIDLLMILASAYRGSGDIPNADKTREQWMSLVDSILGSGSGRDFATAFQVISVAEEYAVLRVLGLQVTGQSLRENGGSEFDIMQVKNPRSGADITLYFNVDLPKKWLNRKLSAPAK